MSKPKTVPALRWWFLTSLVALLIVSVFAGTEYAALHGDQSKNEVLSSSISKLQNELQNSAQNANNASVSAELIQTWLSHLVKLENLNASGALQDYSSGATLVMSGPTMGATLASAENFTGTGQISLPLQYLFGNESNGYTRFSPRDFNITIETFNATSASPDRTQIVASLIFAGSSRTFGAFSGSISAEWEYSFVRGAWLISEEYLHFDAFNVQYSKA